MIISEPSSCRTVLFVLILRRRYDILLKKRERNYNMFSEDIETVRDVDCEIKDKTYDKEVIADVDCYGYEFQSVVFSGCRFISCDMTKTSFYRCRFEKCDLSNCKFIDGYFKECEFSHCKANGANFGRGVIKQSVFKSTSLTYGLFSETNFDDCKIADCDMSGVLLSQSVIKRTELKDVKLIGAELFHASIRGLDLSKCDISGIVLSRELSELRGVTVNFEQAADLAKLLGVIVK